MVWNLALQALTQTENCVNSIGTMVGPEYANVHQKVHMNIKLGVHWLKDAQIPSSLYVLILESFALVSCVYFTFFTSSHPK